MSLQIPEADLPTALSLFAAAEMAYPDALQRTADALLRGLPVLVECDKELTPFFYKSLRDRLRQRQLRCIYLDGRAQQQAENLPQTLVAAMINQLRDAARGAADRRVIVLPHLDLLTTSRGGMTVEAREVIPLMYENPHLLWLGFRDPTFPVPEVIGRLFTHVITISGTPRGRLQHLVTQAESRKLGRDGLDLYRLYKHVSGLNAVRLRRLLGALEGEDYPQDAEPAWTQIREGTLGGSLSIPRIDLHTDIGGYERIKARIERDVLQLMRRISGLSDPAQIERVERLLPKGMIFWGPPGTGKTLFAKALATALGAAVQVIAGPELKSRWVGESEERLRRVFAQARQSAPSLIIFDELDSFASTRGTYTGSGVEHSMVNQLLTELDGFRDNEQVFVVGTTNFVDALDPALMRPGRLEFKLHIPYPNAEDRRAILEVYDGKLELDCTPEALSYLTRQTGYPPDAHSAGWSGDHLQALCRVIARARLREGRTDQTSVLDVDAAIAESRDAPKLTAAEELVVATHECGHAIVAMACPHIPPIERISIRADLAGALGMVQHVAPADRHVITHARLLDTICLLFGGLEAERHVLGELSIGAAHDLQRATELARQLVEEFGHAAEGLPLRDFSGGPRGNGLIAEQTRASLDTAVASVLDRARARCVQIIESKTPELLALRTLLLEKKVLDARALAEHPQLAGEGDREDG